MPPGPPPDRTEDDAEPIELGPEDLGPGEEAIDFGPDESPSILEAAIAEATRPDPKADIAFYEAEAAACEPADAARLIHEVGHIEEHLLGQESAALKAYARALTADPTLRANLWALRRIFVRRRLGKELLKLLDAELRFAPTAGPEDRADLHTERGNLLEDTLDRDGEAAASYRAALDEAPGHPGALVSLLLLAARTGDDASLAPALDGLQTRTGKADVRAALAIELGRRREDVERRFETLEAALRDGAIAEPVLREMDRVSLLSDAPSHRRRALDAAIAHFRSADPVRAAALLRERAHAVGKTSVEDARAALREAAQLDPRHPLVVSDLLDLTEDGGTEATADGVSVEAAFVLRRAEALARSGRPAEAALQLATLPAADVVTEAARRRFLAQAGDAAGYLEAIEAEARAIATPAAAATHWVEAGALGEAKLGDVDRAEQCYRQALACAPGFRPAVEALARLLRAAGRSREICDAYQAELPTAQGERRRFLLEALVALHRDELHDPDAALTYQERLVLDRPDDVGGRVRLIELEAAEGPRRADDMVELARRAGSPPVEAALLVEAARTLARDPRHRRPDGRTGSLLREALAIDPSNTAASLLEHLLTLSDPEGSAAQRVDLVTTELHAAEKGGRTGVARALRFRLAALESRAGRLSAAVGALAPLRRQNDAIAGSWSWDLARRGGDLKLERALLEDVPARSAGQDLALGEALEATDDPEAAAACFARCRGTPVALDAALGSLRLAARAGHPEAVAGALRHLGEEATPRDPEAAEALRAEADLYAAAAGLPVSPSARAGAEGTVLAWASSQGGEPRVASEALEALAYAFSGDDGRALADRAALRARLGGGGPPRRTGDRISDGEDRLADGHLRQAAEMFTEVLAGSSGSLEAADGLRRVARAAARSDLEARALERMGEVAADDLRAAQLHAEAALILEAGGGDVAAATARLYDKVLDRAPDDEEAYDRLHRILAGRATDGRQDMERLLTRKIHHVSHDAHRTEILLERAAVRRGLGRHREAVFDLRRVLEIDPEHPEALERLGRLALETGRGSRAVDLFRRLFDAARNDDDRTEARFLLSSAFETAGDLPAAVDALETVMYERPGDATPLRRLADLFERQKRWPEALESLRGLVVATRGASAQAEVELRIGRLLRDRRKDREGAAAAFVRSLELDLGGPAVEELCALYESAGDLEGRRIVLERAVSDARAALAGDPFNAGRLLRLRGLLSMAGRDDEADCVAQALALVQPGEPAPPSRPLERPLGPDSVRGRLLHPTARGLAADVWPLITEAAARMNPVDAAARGATRHTRVHASDDRRVTWIENAARAFGLPKLALHVSGEEGVTALELPEPVLIIGEQVLTGEPHLRFAVGRALGLLALRASALEGATNADLALLFASAAAVAGAPAPSDIPAAALEARSKAMAKVLGRKEKKGLLIVAGRLPAEPIDVSAWSDGMLRTADRVGLLVAGDLPAAVQVVGDLGADASPEEMRFLAPVVDLLEFALGEDYAALRRELGLSRGAA